jgi:hypothetical protein
VFSLICTTGSIVFFGWTLYNSWDTATNHSWENFWVQEAFLHLLFTFVLVGILLLWRPTMNNSRYAYAALETDLLEDEEYHVVPNFGSETMKSRTLSSRGKGHTMAEKDDVEDALQWVEENIPMAVSVISNAASLLSLFLFSLLFSVIFVSFFGVLLLCVFPQIE